MAAGSGGRSRRPGQLEAEVLAALWAADRALSPGEVQAALGGGLAYTTVMTILNRLHAKGELTRMADGRTFVYQPAVSTVEFTARRMRGMLEQVDDPAGVLARFVDTLGPGEEQVLRDLLDRRRLEG
ncbi:BlaI/MecI/CopY family transcriptional regulator [Frankia sp. KB5]|uniref:BlaI/MecI/CopY family transcriptional regulator n=1 Tax=Frankia sp. KB5 TaxID=683318 RepID=UPI000A11EBCA|nr:BlaI/MecI/CopY family transcriptional regulator [Frankia sp. KB5]ORT46507.1 CopY family transcriptional regulator [Frankia sp. KB5]ORT47453.1 CopY family transcriptional regulator [Frankia sp. KB5]